MDDIMFAGNNGNKKRFTTSLDDDSSPPKKIIVIVLFLILLIASGVLGSTYFLNTSNEKTNSSPTPTITSIEFPTDVPSTTPLPTSISKQSPAPSIKPTTSSKKNAALEKSNLSVVVQNGSGEVGAASKVSETLKEFGYHVVSVGNADEFSYEGMTIQVKNSKSAYLPLLKKDLSGVYTISSVSATLSDTTASDALIIVGKE